jgi:hypothetical protein
MGWTNPRAGRASNQLGSIFKDLFGLGNEKDQTGSDHVSKG